MFAKTRSKKKEESSLERKPGSQIGVGKKTPKEKQIEDVQRKTATKEQKQQPQVQQQSELGNQKPSTLSNLLGNGPQEPGINQSHAPNSSKSKNTVHGEQNREMQTQAGTSNNEHLTQNSVSNLSPSHNQKLIDSAEDRSKHESQNLQSQENHSGSSKNADINNQDAKQAHSLGADISNNSLLKNGPIIEKDGKLGEKELKMQSQENQQKFDRKDDQSFVSQNNSRIISDQKNQQGRAKPNSLRASQEQPQGEHHQNNISNDVERSIKKTPAKRYQISEHKEPHNSKISPISTPKANLIKQHPPSDNVYRRSQTPTNRKTLRSRSQNPEQPAALTSPKNNSPIPSNHIESSKNHSETHHRVKPFHTFKKGTSKIRFATENPGGDYHFTKKKRGLANEHPLPISKRIINLRKPIATESSQGELFQLERKVQDAEEMNINYERPLLKRKRSTGLELYE